MMLDENDLFDENLFPNQTLLTRVKNTLPFDKIPVFFYNFSLPLIFTKSMENGSWLLILLIL